MNYPGTCFNILANDVIFDCQGFTIDGNDEFPNKGISSSSRSNVTIQNCNVSDFWFGFSFGSVTNSTIENCSTYSNAERGILLSNSQNIYVQNYNSKNDRTGVD